MNTSAVSSNEFSSAAGLLAENVRIYLQVKGAFEQCDPAIQAVITDMTEIVRDPHADVDERQRALDTIVEAMFPNVAADTLASAGRQRKSPAAQALVEEMSREEATFSECLETWIAKKNLTQEELGTRIGISQSAIANLLNRNCRPQRKTILRLAEALEIAPEELWPNFTRD